MICNNYCFIFYLFIDSKKTHNFSKVSTAQKYFSTILTLTILCANIKNNAIYIKGCVHPIMTLYLKKCQTILIFFITNISF